MSIAHLLDRPGLAVDERLLVLGLAAIWRADWPRLREVARLGQDRDLPRAAFEEMLLQSVLFCGFPRAVTAFEQFGEAWPAPSPPRGGALPAGEQRQAGDALFDAIYGKNSTSVRGMLTGFHADFEAFVLEVAYGRILARPGLDGRRRELLAIGALAASDQKRQFAGHARGALHLGATRNELREVLETVFADRPDDAIVAAWLHRVPAVD
ncbi:MAG: carboxymuconolactone decarboxylase family protein [bacterium]|nr:carboxymuconolactone decarboxylase family protein [bacterium]